MDGFCVVIEGECVNDVVLGLGCNEFLLCCFLLVCKNMNIWGQVEVNCGVGCIEIFLLYVFYI